MDADEGIASEPPGEGVPSSARRLEAVNGSAREPPHDARCIRADVRADVYDNARNIPEQVGAHRNLPIASGCPEPFALTLRGHSLDAPPSGTRQPNPRCDEEMDSVEEHRSSLHVVSDDTE
jgi:hypothetical protein